MSRLEIPDAQITPYGTMRRRFCSCCGESHWAFDGELMDCPNELPSGAPKSNIRKDGTLWESIHAYHGDHYPHDLY